MRFKLMGFFLFIFSFSSFGMDYFAHKVSKKIGLTEIGDAFFKNKTIRNKYRDIREVQAALQRTGLHSANMILGIDFTSSNLSKGQYSFGGKSLHQIDHHFLNPYQQVISILGQTLSAFDPDGLIPTYGYGDSTTKNHSVFSFNNGYPCRGFREVIEKYNQIAPSVRMSAPTSFLPIVREAINIVRQTGQYHILVIIGDGGIANTKKNFTALSENKKILEEASYYPLSIIMVGVGDGPWSTMKNFDDRAGAKRFDNFQFVDFHRIMKYYQGDQKLQEAMFAAAALQEIPDQYKAIQRLGYLNNGYHSGSSYNSNYHTGGHGTGSYGHYNPNGQNYGSHYSGASAPNHYGGGQYPQGQGQYINNPPPPYNPQYIPPYYPDGKKDKKYKKKKDKKNKKDKKLKKLKNYFGYSENYNY